MPFKKKVLPLKNCLVCGKQFRPVRKWQKYDLPKCNQKAFSIRLAEKIERLEANDSKRAVGQ